MDKTKLLKKRMKKASKVAIGATTKIFNLGMNAGYNEGLDVAQDYINSIVFKGEAEYPLTVEELLLIFGDSEPEYIFRDNDIRTIMKKIKRYKKNKE